MVNYKQVTAANIIYLTSFLAVLVSSFIVPTFIETTVSVFSDIGFTDNTLEAIAWFGLIIIWVLSMLVMPVILQILGLQEQPTITSKLGSAGQMVIGALWFLFSAAFFYISRDIFTTHLPNAIPADMTLVKILYWISLLTAIAMNVLVIPTYTIIQARQETEAITQ